MKEMTDQEFTNKIRQVFDNFEDPSAEHGWQELRKKYPKNDRKLVPLWWAAAAVFLLVGGLWFLAPEKDFQDQKLANKKPALQKSTDDINSANMKDAHNNPGITSIPQISVVNNNSPENIQDENLLPADNSPVSNASGRVDTFNSELIQPSQILPTLTNHLRKTALIALPTYSSLPKNTAGQQDSLIHAAARRLALAKSDPVVEKHNPPAGNLPYNSQKTPANGNVFSFYAGSYFNYAAGSQSNLNFGAGFTSDIKLANNLKLSTGLGLANNSLTYNNGVPISAERDNSITQNLPHSSPSTGNGGSGSANFTTITTITKYNAKLLSLDIPVNIKYMIIPEENKFYFLAGLSSGTYLTESYALDYRNYSATLGAYTSQTQGAEVKKQLQGFDFARILNISMGYSTNLGKTQNITIEPFLKYPLGGLGSEDLKFGSAGINLKLNFSQFTK